MESEIEDVGHLSLSLQSYDTEDELVLEDENSNENPDSLLSLKSLNCSVPTSQIRTPEDEEYVAHIAGLTGISGASAEKLQKLGLIHDKVLKAQQKNLQAKVLLDAVKDAVSDDSKLPARTKQRVSQVLDHFSMVDLMESSTSFSEAKADSDAGILGITAEMLLEVLPKNLPPSDIKALKLAVENQLSLKLKRLSETKNCIQDTLGFSYNVKRNLVESCNTSEVLKLKRELDQGIALHRSLLIQHDAILGRLSELKRNSFLSAQFEMCSSVEHRSSLLTQQLRALKLDIIKESYTEDPHVLDAYKELKKQIGAALLDAKSHLSNLKDMERKYMELEGTEYDNLLRQYRMLRKDLDQKKFALEKFL